MVEVVGRGLGGTKDLAGKNCEVFLIYGENKMVVMKTPPGGTFCLVIDFGCVEAYPEGRVKMQAVMSDSAPYSSRRRTAMRMTTLAWLLVIALAACTPAETPAPTATPIPPTVTPIPPTTIPTKTPGPTNTPTPDPLSSGVPVEVDVGGYTLSIRCFGKGSPVVVLENELGESWPYWRTVYSKLPSTVRVCMYDRSGKAHTSQEIVEDLHALLTGAHLEGPYVLVGHSFGGLNVILYASRYPDEVAGIVLEDSSHPDQDSRFLAVLPPESSDESSDLASIRNDVSAPPHDIKGVDWVISSDQVRVVKSLGDVPLIVLTAAPGSIYSGRIPTDVAASLDQAWQDMQNDLARLSSNSTHIVATKVGHTIHYQEPQLVVDAILDLVNKARSK
jgi:pimeloyl-ACP methyl ester carboxylesterase